MSVNYLIYIIVLSAYTIVNSSQKILSEKEKLFYRDKVKSMFYHAYDGYLQYGYPYDELKPITCDGHDTWGSYSLTLVDSLSTLAIIGNYSEFRRVANLLSERLSFDTDINVSVFETNIRVLGGLLSAHLLSRKAGAILDEGYPCSGPLLSLAEKLGRKLLPAFNTTTGMPYGTVNLMHGVPKGETPVTCTAGAGTFIVEFGTLSKLTGDDVFINVALRALKAIYNLRSPIDLVGNHIDVMNGKWTAIDAGIGAGVDSYFEYLVKGSILFSNPELIEMYHVHKKAIDTYMKHDDWYFWVNMKKGSVTQPIYQSLDAFWPGMQSLIGEIDEAMGSLHNFYHVWSQFGATPEFYSVVHNDARAGREGYPLRPELIESIMYLYQATKDPILLEMGIDILESIEYSTRTKCGYATMKNVKTHELENRMESFFLAETVKYLYLLFDEDNFIHNTGSSGSLINTTNGECIVDTGFYVFNTEAHPIDGAAILCCSAEKKADDDIIHKFNEKIDLLSLTVPSLSDTLLVQNFDSLKKKDTSGVKSNTDYNSHQDSLKYSDELDFEFAFKDEHFDMQSMLNSMESLVEDMKEYIDLNKPITDDEFDDKMSFSENNENEIISACGADSEIAANETDKFEDPENFQDREYHINENQESNDSYNHKKSESKEHLLTCPTRPFHSKLSVMGEMFNL